MKGIFYTISTFLIMGGLVTLLLVTADTNIQRSTITAEQISSQRIYYYWSDVDDNFYGVINVEINKTNETLQIKDELPSTKDLNELLEGYGEFIDQYLEDGTIDIRFENDYGNEINLTEIGNNLVIHPFNLNYSWPDKGKDSLLITIEEENFSFIDHQEVYLELQNVYFDCNVTATGGSDRCNKWAPDSSVPDCDGVEYCLDLLLTVEDGMGVNYTYPEHYFDVSRTSRTNLPVKNDTSGYFIKIQVGPLPLLLEIDLHNVLTKSDIKLIFNTTEFYINYPTILNVSTTFGKRVDYL